MTQAQKHIANQGTVNQVTTAHVRLELPEHVFDQYSGQADKVGKDPELLMTERLIRCAPQIESGLYFTNDEKKRLEKCLGHMVSDGTGALQRLEPMSKIDVGGVTITLDALILKKLSTRTLRGQTLEQLIEKTVTKALRQYVGLEPY